jgi:glycogen debranching enzyme
MSDKKPKKAKPGKPQPKLPKGQRWKTFGQLEGDEGDAGDPQRHVSTTFISRAGPSALAVISKNGDIDSEAEGDTGFYSGDMRLVSRLTAAINGKRTVARKSVRGEAASEFSFELEDPAPGVKAHLDYTFSEESLFVRLRLKNTGLADASITATFNCAADHFDSFYVRFPPKPERGTLHEAVKDADGMSVRYDALDKRKMVSYLRFSEPPAHNKDGAMGFSRTLKPQEEWEIVIKAGLDAAPPARQDWVKARDALRAARDDVFAGAAVIRTENKALAQWLKQSREDISLLTARQDTGLYTYAGLPWFARPFGRDGLLTALELLPSNPAVAEGALRHHAKMMARKVDTFSQAQPGKCMHESRLGDLCGAGVLPFKQYYGGVDTALLFVMTAHAWWKRTGDDATMKELWPAVDLALDWIKNYGDLDKDGLVKYTSDPGMGLANQGWKDSWDSIMFEDGEFATAPIALCEVQGYAYAAWRGGQEMAAKLGLNEKSATCATAADKLYKVFNDVFWQEDKGYYALAIAGKDDRPCRVRASNMAHLDWCGIVPPERRQGVIDEVMGPELYSGWGIRTLGSGESRYKPDVYHRGPVWPHEAAVFARGCRAAGDGAALQKICADMLDAAKAFEYRLPELFCGYEREPGKKPVPYPSANSPHSWAAGLAFSLVDSALGLEIDGKKGEISVNPDGLPRDWGPLSYEHLRVGGGTLSFRVEPEGEKGWRLSIVEQTGSPLVLRDARDGKPVTARAAPKPAAANTARDKRR